MILCTQVLYIINARIRIVQNFVDRPSASTSSASSQGVFVPLNKAFYEGKDLWQTRQSGHTVLQTKVCREICYITIYRKKHLPKKIVPLSVPFFGLSC